MDYTPAQIHEATVSWLRSFRPDDPIEVLEEQATKHIATARAQGRSPAEMVANLERERERAIKATEDAIKREEAAARTARFESAAKTHLAAPDAKRELARADELAAQGDERKANSIRSTVRNQAHAKAARETRPAPTSDEIRTRAIKSLRSTRPWLWPSWERGSWEGEAGAEARSSGRKRSGERSRRVSQSTVDDAVLMVLGASTMRSSDVLETVVAMVHDDAKRSIGRFASHFARCIASTPVAKRNDVATAMLTASLRTPAHATPEQRAILALGAAIDGLKEHMGADAFRAAVKRIDERKRQSAVEPVRQRGTPVNTL